MPDDLDDFDLEPTRRLAEGETVLPYRPDPEKKPGGLFFPATLALVAVIAIALLAVVFFVFRHPSKPKAESAPAPLAAAPASVASPQASPAVPLPRLDESDGFVRHVAAALSSSPEVARWLARTALVRTLTVVVVNIAAGETPRPHLDFLAPKQRFRAARRPARLLVPDPAGFAGYDLFGDAIASVDAAVAASAYRTTAPLFDAAYVELGHPEGGFRAALDEAIRDLLTVPVLREDVVLVPHAIGFQYADAKLEALTPAQKQFLRIGPRNVRLVQGKLKELAAALAPVAPAAP
jgi:hypothetical protein